ncbi:MAG: 50S ribosomal protein L11 methyltransferase [Thermodesulfobacteriota bacterium]|nr:50S ribosomal protein L11 methyltransferase [Thermodesulfobacteriota bacterium]
MKTKNNSYEKDHKGPYENLYIYYFQGQVDDKHERHFGEHFLGNWVEENNSFLFFSRPSHEIISGIIQRQPGLELIDDYFFTYDQWQGNGLTSIRIENVIIVTPWEDKEIDKGEKKIIIDPGMVFGSGLHPTTRDCLKALIYLQRHDPVERVLDLGTGTGILALTVASLGAKNVLAVDLNPLSVKTTQKNIQLNHAEKVITVIKGKAEDFVHETADLVVANIHFEVIARLIEKKCFKDKRWLIISGLMRSQARDVKAKLEAYDLQVKHEWDHEMTWYTLLVKNERRTFFFDLKDPGKDPSPMF